MKAKHRPMHAHPSREHIRSTYIPRGVHRPKSMGLGGRAIGPARSYVGIERGRHVSNCHVR